MDHGHPLQLGTFITPANDSPQVPVELARLSEELGYDLVTFQDHPYGSSRRRLDARWDAMHEHFAGVYTASGRISDRNASTTPSHRGRSSGCVS